MALFLCRDPGPALAFQPGQGIGKHLVPVQFIEHFVAAAGVKLHGHVLAARLPEPPRHLQNTFSHGPHRVAVPGEEVNGGGLVHPLEIFPAAHILQARHHGVVHPRRGLKTAQRVGQIGVHHPLVPADPVRRCAAGLEGVVIRPDGQLVKELVHLVGIPQAGEQLARNHGDGALLAGTREDAARQGTGGSR